MNRESTNAQVELHADGHWFRMVDAEWWAALVEVVRTEGRLSAVGMMQAEGLLRADALMLAVLAGREAQGASE